jgi:hypothetical protein
MPHPADRTSGRLDEITYAPKVRPGGRKAGVSFNEQNRSSIVLCRSYNTDSKAMAGTSANPNNTAAVRSTEFGNCARGTTGLVRV